MISCIVRGDEEDAATVLQRCIDRTALAGGGVVYIPGGTWRITRFPGVRLRDNVHIRVAPHARIIRDRDCASPFVGEGIEHFSIIGATIDINRHANFCGAISLERCRHFRLHDCTLGSSVAPPLDDTIHAILMQDCDDWDIYDIRTRYAQVKLAGGRGARRGRCRRIRANDARNYAVALVLGLGPEDRAIEDCTIEDVQVYGYCAGAVYLGCDQRNATGVMRRVRVRDVYARGPSSTAGRGVLMVLCRETEDVEISDIETHHSYYAEDAGNPNGVGVCIATAKDGTGAGRDIRIKRVLQRGRTMFASLLVEGPIEGLQLEDLDLDCSYQYRAIAGSISGTTHRVRVRSGIREDVARNGHTINMREAA